MRALVTSRHLSCHIGVEIRLLQVVGAVEVDVRIAVRVRTQLRIIDGRSVITFGESVVAASFVVQRHVAVGIQVFGVCLRHIDTGIGTHVDAHRLVLAALGRDEDHSLRGTAAVEYDGGCILHNGDALHLGSPHVACATGYPVDEHQRFLSPDVSGISADVAVQPHQTVRTVHLLEQLRCVDRRDGCRQVFARNLAECHVHQAVLLFLCPDSCRTEQHAGHRTANM